MFRQVYACDLNCKLSTWIGKHLGLFDCIAHKAAPSLGSGQCACGSLGPVAAKAGHPRGSASLAGLDFLFAAGNHGESAVGEERKGPKYLSSILVVQGTQASSREAEKEVGKQLFGARPTPTTMRVEPRSRGGRAVSRVHGRGGAKFALQARHLEQ